MREARGLRSIPVSNSDCLHERYASIEVLKDEEATRVLRVHDRLRGEDVILRTIVGSDRGQLAQAGSVLSRYAKIDHPFLTRVLDCGQLKAGAFYTREDARGSDISETLKTPNEEWLFRLIIETLEGLASLHKDGLIHGLVIPEHLRIITVGSRLGGLRITDGGLRHILEGGTATRVYDSPEVRDGAELSPVNDLYQLGVTVIRAIGGVSGLTALEQGRQKPFRSLGTTLDVHLLDLLDTFVAADARKRPLDASHALKIIRGSNLGRSYQVLNLEDVLSPEFVGNERAIGQLRHVLRGAKENRVHGAEVVGEEGIGKTRILRELAVEAASGGWQVLVLGADTRSIEQFAELAAKALNGVVEFDRNSVAFEDNDQTLPITIARQVCGMVDKHGNHLLVVADDADQLPRELQSVLRVLASEAGPRPVAVIGSANKPIGIPDAETMTLDRLEERDVRRLLAPLVTSGIRPDLAISRLYATSGGNPLWVRLILASWIQSGQLRLTEGRPCFDERIVTPVSQNVREAIQGIAARLSSAELGVVHGLAVWGGTMELRLAKALFQTTHFSNDFVEVGTGGARLIAESVREVMLASLSPAAHEEWHARILAVLDRTNVDSRTYAKHLLGAGRIEEAAEVLLRSADSAEAMGDVRTAWQDLKTVFESTTPGSSIGVLTREEIGLRAGHLSLRIGERSWTQEILPQLPKSRGRGGKASRYRYELAMLHATVLREQHHFTDAAQQYAAARALVSADLIDRLPEIALEEAENDLNRGEYVLGIRRLTSVMPTLESSPQVQLYAGALHRLAVLEDKAGETERAIQLGQRAARLAMRIKDWLLVARGATSLGLWYVKCGRPDRALRALERAERALERCPHDGYRATLLERRAQILLEQGKYDSAEGNLLEAELLHRRMGDHGHLPIVLVELGRLYRHQGRLAEAARRYREAVALAEEFSSAVVNVARANLAELLAFEGEHAAAEPLFRTALQQAYPSLKGMTFLLLGRLLGKQGKHAEALKCLDMGEAILRKYPALRCLAQLEIAELLLAAKQSDAAMFRLAQIATEVPAEGEHRATYDLLMGRAMAASGNPNVDYLASAIAVAERHNDPTFTAHVLCEALETAASLRNVPAEWMRTNLERLASNACRTDSRTIDVRSRLVRDLVNVDKGSSGSGEIAVAIKKWLDSPGDNEHERSLGDSVKHLEQAAGAMVLVIGVDKNGAPIVSPIPRAPEPEPVSIQPYRIASKEFNRKIFREALKTVEGNAIEAARLLRLPYSTFRYQAEKLGILKPVRRGPRRKKKDAVR